MSPTIYGEETSSERMLIAMHPAFAWAAKHAPSAFGAPDANPPHPSAMLVEHNRLWRLIFPRFFNQINIDRNALEELRETAKSSTLVYVAKGAGQLEYHYFNHLFKNEGLPLAQYTNALTLRRWMRWGSWWTSLRAAEHEIGEHGRPRDPLADNELPRMIADGKSVLLTLPASGLTDDGMFFAGPARALIALIEAQRLSEKPIAIVPLDFLWSDRPERAKRTIVDMLFGEKENPGRIRKIALFWRNYKEHAQAAIGHPIDLRSFIAREGGDDAHLASGLRHAQLGALKAKRRTIIGPPIRPRRWFINEVTSDEELDDAICRIAAERGKPADDVRELAARYAGEIAADLDYTTIEILDRVLGYVFNRIFDGIQLDREGLGKARELCAEGPVIFVPNHKSHADYLILSHLLHRNGMTVPHIAAGINLEFWPLGPIFRRGGAYFIRRAFRDNPLYKAVLETYLKVLLREGYSQEFFFEGGRSRSGKLLSPKKGMFTMLHAAAARAGVRNMRFIPVAITYDRVIEQKSYEKELEGGAKDKEGTSALLRLTRFLKRQGNRYGSIYVRFGEPVPQIQQRTDAPAIEALANRISHEINRRAVVTPAALAASALLASGRRGVTQREFDRSWGMLLDYLRAKGVELSERIRSAPDSVSGEALELLSQSRLVIPRTDAVVPFHAIDESKRVPLSYFKNGIVHFYTTIGTISALLIKRASSTAGEVPFDALAADFEGCRRLFAHEFRFATRRNPSEHAADAVEFLVSRGAIERHEGGKLAIRRDGAWICDLFSAQIMPFAETMMIASRHIMERMEGAQDERQLLTDLLRTGQDLLLLEYAKYRESVTKQGFQNAIKALVSIGMLLLQEPEAGTKRRNIYAPTQESGGAATLKEELEKIL